MSIISTASSSRRGRLAERIEVDADEVERLDVVRGQVGEVFGDVAPRQDPAVHGRVQRHDPVPEHLGEAGHALDPRHREAVLLEVRGRAAARHELAAQLGEARARSSSRPVLS